jgi:hypothetical protein
MAKARSPRGRAEVQLYLFLDLGAKWWWIAKVTLQPLYPWERELILIYGNFSPPPGFELRIVQLIVRRYTD